MIQKMFLVRGKINKNFSKEELDAFDKKINNFHLKNNIKASQVQLCVAFDHIYLLETVWFEGQAAKPGKEIPVKKEIINEGRGEEIGALWKWKRDGTLRGDFRKEKVDLDENFFRDNAEIKKDKEENEFYILEIKGERCLIFPVLNKVKANQPDYRIYEG